MSLQNSLGSEFAPKIKLFCEGLVLFITIDRLEQASGETFWQWLSTSALVSAQNDKGFGLWLGNSSDSLLFSPVLQGNKLMGSCSRSFLLVSLCVTSGPSGPISSRFGKGLEVFEVWRCYKHVLVKGHSRRLCWKPALDSCVWGTMGFRGDFPFLLLRQQRHLIIRVQRYAVWTRYGRLLVLWVPNSISVQAVKGKRKMEEGVCATSRNMQPVALSSWHGPGPCCGDGNVRRDWKRRFGDQVSPYLGLGSVWVSLCTSDMG